MAASTLIWTGEKDHTFGKTHTCKISSDNPNYKHALECRVRGWLLPDLLFYRVGSGTQSFTIPLEWLKYLKDSAKEVCSFRLITFVNDHWDGKNLIGYRDYSGILWAGPEIVPEIDAIRHIDNTTNAPAVLETSEVYLQNVSKIDLQTDITLAYESPITNIKVEFDGKVLGNTTNPLTQVNLSTNDFGTGIKKVKVTVTDQRKRTATKEINLEILPYQFPKIISVSAARISEGLSIKFEKSAFVENVKIDGIEKNTYTTVTEFRPIGSDNWTIAKTEFNAFGDLTLGEYAVDRSYEFLITLRDQFSSASNSVTVSTAVTLMDKCAGEGLGVMKLYEEGHGALDVGGMIWMLGKSLVDFFLPIGHVLITYDSTNPSERYPNTTWERTGKGKVLVGVDEDDPDFAEGVTGGEKKHQLNIESNKSTNEAGFTVSDRGDPPGYGLTKSSSFQDRVAVALDSGPEWQANPHNNLQPYETVYFWKRVPNETVKLYTIKFVTNGGTAIRSQTVEAGHLFIRPTNPDRTDYTFAGWYADEELTQAFDFDTIPTEDVTVYAKWTAVIKRYVLTFVTNGGGTIASQTVNQGQQFAKPLNPTKAGYSFGGWYTNSGLTSAYDFDTPATKDVTLYAKWTAVTIQYTLTFVTNDGGTIASQTVNAGELFRKPTDPEKAGNTFNGWYLDNDTWQQAFDFNTPATSDVTIYAKWLKAAFPLTLTAVGTKLDIVDGIYVGVGNKLEKYDLDGNLVWSKTVTGTITTVLNIDQVIMVGTDVGWVVAYDFNGGKFFETNVGFGITGFALNDESIVVATVKGAYVYALSGQKIQDIDSQFNFTLAKTSGERLIVALDLGNYREVNCFDLNLTLKWSKQDIPYAAISADTLGTDFVVGFKNGGLDRISEAGNTTWSKTFSGDVNAVFVAETNIYIGTSANHVYKLSSAGNIVWQKTFNAAVTDIHEQNGHLYAITGKKLERMDA